MSMRGNTSPSQNPMQNDGAVQFLGLVAVVGFVVALFAASIPAAIIAAVYVALAGSLVLGIREGHRPRLRPAMFLLIASGAMAILSPIVVFDFRWVDFTAAEIIVAAIYAASLAIGLFAALKTLWRYLATAIAVALALFIVFAPVPKGGEPDDEGWSVKATIHDSDDQPVSGALVQCGVVFLWEGGIAFDATGAHATDSSGEAEPWDFHEDRRMKAAFCSAVKASDSGNAGFPTGTAVLAPIQRGENEVEIALSENAHSDTAYLVVQLASVPRVGWFTLQYELWRDSPEGLPAGGDVASGRTPIATTDYSDVGKKDFSIPASESNGDLYLRYYYEGPSSDTGIGPPKDISRIVHVGPIEAGKRQTVLLDIPWSGPSD